MPQNIAIRTVTPEWDFLEPAMDPNSAREWQVVIPAAGSGLYVAYRPGQILRQKNDGTNNWDKVGTSGFGGPPSIIKYPMLVNDAGQHQITNKSTWQAGDAVHEGSVNAYYYGKFKTQDLIGAGGTNQIQTETFDAGVDGGTRTLRLFGYTTAPIAWNASAATIKTAILLAVPVLLTADITVAGTGPYTYTFTGAYAGSNSIPLIVVDPALLTDGGVAPATTGSVMAISTPGAGLLTGIGRIMRGTSSNGIMELGVGAPS